MPIVVVYTDKGEQVWQSPAIGFTLRPAKCPGNTIGSALVSGLRRAIEDAEAIEAGDDPERPSEKAMRLSDREAPAFLHDLDDEFSHGLGEVDGQDVT